MKGLTPDERKKLILSVGTHKSKRKLSPIEVAELMKKALDAGEDSAQIAAALHLDGSTMVGRFTKLLKLDPQVQLLVGWGADDSTISFTSAYEIARLPLMEDQKELVMAIVKNQMRAQEIRQIIQIKQRTNQTIGDCVSLILERRPVIVRRHVIVGGISSKEVIMGLSNLSQLERNDILKRVIEEILPNISDYRTKLGPDQFVIVGDDNLHSSLMALSGGFENQINQKILSKLDERIKHDD